MGAPSPLPPPDIPRRRLFICRKNGVPDLLSEIERVGRAQEAARHFVAAMRAPAPALWPFIVGGMVAGAVLFGAGMFAVGLLAP